MADLTQKIQLVVEGFKKVKNIQREVQKTSDLVKELASDFRQVDRGIRDSQKTLNRVGRDRYKRDAKGRFVNDPDRNIRRDALSSEVNLIKERKVLLKTNSALTAKTTALNAAKAKEIDLDKARQKSVQTELRLQANKTFISRKLIEGRAAGLRPTGFGLSEKPDSARGKRRTELNQALDALEKGFNDLNVEGNENVATFRAFGSQISRTVEELNALNRTVAKGSIGFEKARRLQERLDVVDPAKGAKTFKNKAASALSPTAAQIQTARDSSANLLKAARSGDQNLYNAALAKATAQVSRLERAYKEAETVQKKASDHDKKAQRRLRNIRKIRQDRNDRTRESLMLGAGFPLLFGGGIGSVAGGVGGALAQRGGKGFGAQILFSAIGQQFDQLVTTMVASTARLGKALTAFGQNIEEVTRAAGLSNTAEAVRIKLIEEARGKQAAFNAAVRELTNVVGANGVDALRKFGDATNNLANAWSKLMSSIFARLAIAAEKMGITDGLNNIADNFSAPYKKRNREQFLMSSDKSQELTSKFSQQRGIEARLSSFGAGTQLPEAQGYSEKIERTRLGLTRKQYEEVKKLRGEYEKINVEVNKLADKEIEAFNRKQKSLFATEAATKDLTKNTEYMKDVLQLGEKEANIKKEVDERVKQIKDTYGETVDINRAAIEANVRDNEAWKEKFELIQQIKNALATGITNAITGLIEGTKTLKEAFAGILKQIAQIILQKAILSVVDKAFTFGSGGVAKGGTGAMVAADNLKYGNTFPAGSFSTGGMVTRPTLGLVGEAGEDEYIIPASKMASSMQRYSAGARGEAVIPGTGSSYAGGGAGGSTTVNYSGPILNFNSEEFVPKSAVGQIIATATSQGARAGENRTLSTLRNSRSARSRLGM